MSHWTNTAKRLAEHPKWEWREGMLAVEPKYGDTKFRLWKRDEKYWNGSVGEGPWYRVTHEEMTKCFPDLTDWATVGVLLGMCIEAFAAARTWQQRARAIELLGRWLKSLLEAAIMDRDPVVPGQALGELWLELVEKGN